MKVVVTSTDLSSSGNSLLINISLNNFVKVSEQLCTLDFKTFSGMFLNVVGFLILRFFNITFFSMSELFIWLEENGSGPLSLLLIINMFGWCLYLIITFKIGFVMSLCSYITYIYSLICRPLVAFLKLFSSLDTKCSWDIIFSFSSTRAFLLLIFLFSEKKGCIFFQKLFLSETCLDLIYQNQKMLCAPV